MFKKEVWVTGLALFSMFFGAGNLILPPLLGLKAQEQWFTVALGFAITGVVIPIMAIYAHARLQGTLYDFGKKISHKFSIVYCVLIYIIAITLPAPRTASVTHEMAILPFFDSHPLITSIIYFALVLVFVLNRSKILSVLGKFLTPLIVVILLLIMVLALFKDTPSLNATQLKQPIVDGLLEGYQTFDAIGGIVVGAVLIISLQLKGLTSFEEKKALIIKSGLIAGTGLIIIYTGLIATGAFLSFSFEPQIERTALLVGISNLTLGNFGSSCLSVLVALACFTTAVGIVTGTSDYFKSLCNNSKKSYKITAIIACVFGILIGSFNVEIIITIAIPVLFLIYPVTIVLICLNCLPKAYVTSTLFKVVVFTTILFSIPDALNALGDKQHLQLFFKYIPLSTYHLAWLLPAIIATVVILVFKRNTTDTIINSN